MAKMLKGVLVNVRDNDAEVLEIEDELEEFYRIIDCECIDIVSRKIGGNLFIVGRHTNRDGELTSLTNKDVENIQKHIFVAKWDDGKTTPMVVGVEY